MSDGMGREPAYLSSHATNRYFIPNWGKLYILKNKMDFIFELISEYSYIYITYIVLLC